MHAIDTPDKQFKDGNGTSELGTILPAWWLNQIQAELLAVLSEAKIQPNKAKTNQLADAIKQIFSGAVINNLTSDDTNKALSAAMGKKLNEEKVSKTGDEEIGGAKTFTSLLTAGRAEHWGKIRMPVQGGGHWFIEANPQSNFTAGSTLKINIKYEQTSGQVRYIHFPELGNINRTVAYQDWVRTEINSATSDAVKTAGDQTINGKKTFAAVADFSRGLRVSGGNEDYWAELGYAASTIYLKNPVSNKSLQLNNDGSIKYQGDKIMLASDKTDAVNLDDSNKIATAKAVKTLNDKIDNAVPSGTVAYFAGRNAPAGWLKANGAAVSRTTYADLFAAIGTTYGAGDGRTTFNLPDLRGEFVRGFDDGRNIDRGRALGSRQADEIKAHNHMMPAGEPGSPSSWHLAVYGTASDQPYTHVEDFTSATQSSVRHLVSSTGGSETRPRNVALLACIKI
ncbi:tail fiber protein [Neisseria sp. Dent CA1/247]|uniref:tail fiber protein n=1 Tax=Neisseria sp. Dent CA1/247 TaxID=2912675 RepID=UPI001FD5D54F|nr:tail fiber protein [Neisseria sp. Dent CA1/247]UOO77305.1 tail fiber protein [Neisseria sp. Dent CA1/247]